MTNHSRPAWLPAAETAVRLSSPLLFALAWELGARRLHSLLLPGFFETLAALARLLTTRTLWQALWLSNQAMLLGFGLAAAVGVLTGLLMGRWRLAEQYLDPYLSILIAVPKSALIPIVIMAFGLGLTSRVFITFTFAVVVITVNVRAGVRLLEPSWVEMARSFSASERQLWSRGYLPGALPAVLTGLRLGAARAITGMITVELLLVAVGIGRLILEFQGTFRSADLYATILVVIAEAVLVLQLLRLVEQRLAPWAAPEAAS